jgi:integrase
MEMPETERTVTKRQVWNAGRTVGAKRALKPKQIWEIRFYLNQRRRLRDRALFDLAIDSKLRGCDLVQMRIGDLVSSGQVRTRAIVMQQKTGRPVQFELLPDARASLLAWLERRGGTVDDYVFPSRVDRDGHLSTRQYARLVDEWVTGVGLMRSEYGTRAEQRGTMSKSSRDWWGRRPHAVCGYNRFSWRARRYSGGISRQRPDRPQAE